MIVAKKPGMKITALLCLLFFIFSLVSSFGGTVAYAEPVNVALNKPVTSSDGDDINSEHPPANVVDGNVSHMRGWDSKSSQSMKAWVQVDLGDKYIISRVEYVDRTNFDWIGYRSNFEFQASNDPTFATYTVLGGVGPEGFDDDTTWVADVTEQTPYRYVRFQKTKVEYAYVVEIRVFGIPAPTSEPPQWPEESKLTASDIKVDGVTLNWTPATDETGVTGYRIYKDGELLDTVGGDAYSYEVTGLTSETEYTFKVEAGNSDGSWTTDGPSVKVIPGPNIALNKTYSEGNCTSDSGLGPNKAFDGIVAKSNGWSATRTEGIGSWLQVDLQGQYFLNRIEFYDRPGDSYFGERRGFQIQASNDPNFVEYDTLAAVGNDEPIPDDSVFVITLPGDKAYRYVRYQKTNWDYAFVSEIKIYGVLVDAEKPQWPAGSKLTASNVTATGVTLNWTPATDNKAVTRYRIYKGEELIYTTAGNVYKYDVVDLMPETEYTFRVEAGDAAGNWSEAGLTVTVTTLPAPPDTVLLKIYAASDTHSSNHDAKVKLMAQDANENNVDALVLSGDLTNDGAPLQYDVLISTINSNLNNERTKVLYTTGNHDVRYKPGGFEEAKQLFLEKTGMPNVYYDTWIKGYHLIVMAGEKDLENDASISDAQFKWLEEKLAEGADANKPIFLFMHQPFNNIENDQQRERFRNILRQYPQVIYTYGHTHGNVNSATNVKFQECTNLNDGAIARDPAHAILFEVYSDRVEIIARNVSQKSTFRTDTVGRPTVEWVNRELTAIDAVLQNAVIGNQEGQYPLWAKNYLDGAVAEAESYISGTTTPKGLGDTFNKLRIAKTAFIKSKIDSEQEPERFTVSGKVTDELQQPVVGTVVEIYAAGDPDTPVASAITKADGSFAISELISGEYVVKAKYYNGNVLIVIPFTDVSNLVIDVNSGDLTDTTKPVWPGGSKLTSNVVSPTKVKLEWDAATDDTEVTCYKIYLEDELVEVVAGDVYNYTVTGLSPGTVYTFTVYAGDGSGNTTEEGLTASATTSVDTQAPTWPAGSTLTASEKTISSITLNWTQANDNTEVAKYRIYKGTELVAEVAGDVTSYKVTGLEIDTEYTFSVQAGDEFGNWSTDGPACTESTASDTTAPYWTSENALLSSISSETSVKLEWESAVDDTGVAGYRIYEGTNLLDTVNASVNNYEITGLIKGRSYTFSVQAGDEYGNWSTNGPTTTAIPGPNIALGKTYSEGNLRGDAGYGPEKAFDGIIGYGNGWSATRTEGIGVWLQVDLQKEYILNRIEFYDRPNDTYTGERHRFEIQASNDPNFGTYDILVKIGDGTIPDDKVFVVLVDNGKPYRYVRYQKTDWSYAFVSEIKIYGTEEGLDTTPPAWPAGSKVEAREVSQTGLTLTWTAAEDDTAVTGYRIYKGEELLDSVAANVYAYDVTGLTANTTYKFTIQAVDAAGNESADGPSVTVATAEEEPDEEPSIITVNVSVDKVTRKVTISGNISTGENKKVTVRVINPNGATDYIDQSTSGGEGYFEFTYKLTKVYTGTYRVYVGGTGVAEPAEKTFTCEDIIEEDTTAPAWPAGSKVEAREVGQTGLKLTWTAAEDDTAVTGYKIYKGEELLDTVAADVYTYNVTGLTAGTAYTFTVQAVDAAGNESADGPSVTVTTEEEPGEEPATITANVSVDKATRVVTISGNISTGENKNVTVKVINPNGAIDYLNQDTSGEDGYFEFTYKLLKVYSGTYRVYVGGTGVAEPAEKTFTCEDMIEEDTTAPTWPAGSKVEAREVGQTSLKLTWTAAEDDTAVAGYKIYKGEELLDTVAADVYTYNVTGLAADTTYTFTVQAVDAAGNESADGPSVTVTTRKPSGGGVIIIPPISEEEEDEDETTVEVGNDGTITAKPVLGEDNKAVIDITEEDINKAAENAPEDAEGTKEIPIKVEKVDGAEEYVQGIPVSALTDESANKKYIIETEFGTIEVPSNMLTTAEAEGSKTAYLSIRMADKNELSEELKNQIGERPVIELKLKLDDKEIEWSNSSAPVTVSIPYEPTEEELKDPEHIVVWYIDGEGNVISIPSGKYDPETGMVTFTTTHFSKYAVAFVKKTFDDIANYAWAKKEIEVMASKGIINGTSATTFNPSADITRADFIVLLARALGLDTEVDDNFSDVNPDAYYAKQVGIARKLGIAKGSGNNEFRPNDKIERQEMMTLIDRALKVAGKGLAKGTEADLAGFADKDMIASYATDSVAALVKSGIIKGDGTNINPLGNTTRAEAAVVIYRIYNALYSK